jgi:hypothetical protein
MEFSEPSVDGSSEDREFDEERGEAFEGGSSISGSVGGEKGRRKTTT